MDVARPGLDIPHDQGCPHEVAPGPGLDALPIALQFLNHCFAFLWRPRHAEAGTHVMEDREAARRADRDEVRFKAETEVYVRVHPSVVVAHTEELCELEGQMLRC